MRILIRRGLSNHHSNNIDTVLKFLVALVVLAGGAEAAIWSVDPSGYNYTRIRAAICATSSGGTIEQEGFATGGFEIGFRG